MYGFLLKKNNNTITQKTRMHVKAVKSQNLQFSGRNLLKSKDLVDLYRSLNVVQVLSLVPSTIEVIMTLKNKGYSPSPSISLGYAITGVSTSSTFTYTLLKMKGWQHCLSVAVPLQSFEAQTFPGQPLCKERLREPHHSCHF